MKFATNTVVGMNMLHFSCQIVYGQGLLHGKSDMKNAALIHGRNIHSDRNDLIAAIYSPISMENKAVFDGLKKYTLAKRESIMLMSQ